MEAEERIERSFRGLSAASPDWAWPFTPSIPLIGEHVEIGRSVFVYASAENLSWLQGIQIPKRFTDQRAWNRYRAVYEETGRSPDRFFPDVGIQPVSDGGLFCAALFIARQLGLRTAVTPREFLEHVAFSNWGKFTLRTEGRNKDYAGNARFLQASLPYVCAELAVLQPGVVLVPKSIWRRPVFATAMRHAAPSARFVSVPQFNAQVVNLHLRHFHAAGQELMRVESATTLGEWMQHLARMRLENAWRYIACLDLELAPHTGGN